MGTLFLLPESRLEKSPSAQDNLLPEDEYELRILGCELIQSSGLILKLPQTAMATAQVLFQRFYYSKSFVRYPYQHAAIACVVLASKIEEAQLKIREVCRAFHRLNQLRKNVTPTELVFNEKYIKLKDEVVKAERRILKELGYCVYVNHPHKFIVILLQILGSENNQKFVQTAWSYINDALRTDVFLRYSPEAIACSCVYLSARLLGIALPESPPWWEIFLITEEEIQKICKIILKLYTRPKPDRERLDGVIEKLRKDCERIRMNIIKQLNQPTKEIAASPTNDHQATKKIKVEHIIREYQSEKNDKKYDKHEDRHSDKYDGKYDKYDGKYDKYDGKYDKYDGKYDKYDDKYDKYEYRYSDKYDGKYDDDYYRKKSKDRERKSSLKSKDSVKDREYRSTTNNKRNKYRY